ncbi:hypothetical protein [Nostocoides sp. HKS02]|uniref:hypothetical protein n=1 Tax=Nostocoides sp. HKS02 TaxID=1813880 RepID=UPI0012B4C7F0|nr:hypothetical protein [Tetrasphaera sp. HKS02]QGN57309.1 hypothetical protein GKE56_04835 [Tetrasphaera sp. HKS02]
MVQPVDAPLDLGPAAATQPGETGGWRRPWLWAWLWAWLAFLPVALLRTGTMAESDTFWQIRTGLTTIEQRGIPTVDPFSWTVHGAHWTLNSWGYDVLIAVAYRLAGLVGVALTCAVLVMAAAGLVLLLARELGASPGVAGASLWLVAPLLVAWLSARPQLVDYVTVLLLVALLRRVVDDQHPGRSTVLIGVLCAAWVNLHAGALLGVGIAGTCTVVQLCRTRSWERWKWCLAATAAALAGSVVNPLGLGLFAQTAQVKSASTGVVLEWQHLDPADPTQLVMLALGLSALVLAARRRDVVSVAGVGVLAVAAIVAIRFLPLLALMALPTLAASGSHRAVLGYIHSRRAVLLPGAAVAVAATLALALPALTHIGQPLPAIYPAKAVADIPSGCKLFNTYVLGGYVILQRPDVLVSIDSRNDLYGAARVGAAERTLAGRGDVSAALAPAGCALVPPTSGLAKRLFRDPAWAVKTRQASGVLFVRRAGQ